MKLGRKALIKLTHRVVRRWNRVPREVVMAKAVRHVVRGLGWSVQSQDMDLMKDLWVPSNSGHPMTLKDFPLW